MGAELKLASNLAPFSRLRDRFVTDGYGPGHSFHRQLEMLSAIKGISGVGLGWPCQFKSGAALKKAIQAHGLQLATLDTNIYTEARFKNGSLSNADPKIRRAAIDRAKETIDAALAAGAPDVNLWLGHDGFDYFFQGHYADAWQWILDGLAEIAEHDPRLPISVEYKCKEPRANQYLANLGKALWLVTKINKPHVGITLDFGHSLAALENPAEAAVLALREGRLQQVHLNDNYRDWDHDLVPGSVNVWDHVEFFYWLRTLGYRGWFCLDIFPYREDGVEVLRSAVQVCQKCWHIAEELTRMKLEHLLRKTQHMEILRILWDMVRPPVGR
jgi:xylose isomerase